MSNIEIIKNLLVCLAQAKFDGMDAKNARALTVLVQVAEAAVADAETPEEETTDE